MFSRKGAKPQRRKALERTRIKTNLPKRDEQLKFSDWRRLAFKILLGALAPLREILRKQVRGAAPKTDSPSSAVLFANRSPAR
jgi:hypothetical protein